MAKEPYVKINDSDIRGALEHFENEADFNEFMGVLVKFLMQKDFEIKRKRVKIYWKIVENHFRYLLNAKIKGSEGGIKSAEIKADTNSTLWMVVETVVDSTNPTNNKEKNNNNKKDIEERKREFYNSLTPFLETYSKELIREFYNHWSEHGDNDKKFRKEKETSFSIANRLQKWKSNEEKWGKKEKSSGKKESRIDNLIDQHAEMLRINELKYGTE